MFTSKAYTKSPIFVQNILLSSRAFIRKKLRENTNCERLTQKLQTHEFNYELLKQYSHKALSAVVTSANDAIDYYKGTGPDINNYPYIDKPTVNNHKDQFLSPQKKGAVINGATSGTTGAPLVIPQSMKSVITEQAFVNRGLTWAGFEKGDKRAWIRGDMIVPLEQKQAPFWRYSYFENMIVLSSFHMAPKNLHSYINAMVDFGVQVIQAYPSSIVTLAKYLEINNEYYPGEIKSVVTSSESLTKEDKHLIETRFKCTVFDWYGLFERVAAIASCEYSRYHILTDYAHVELLPAGKTEDGRDRAEIVGTNFNNSLYPLIRYKTGDHVILSEEKHCPCGRVFPLVDSIEGRTGDYLVAEDRQNVHILNHIPKGVEGLLGAQFVQKKDLSIDVWVVVDKTLFKKDQEDKLILNTKERLGASIKVSVKTVDAIPRTKNGKVKQAIREF
ncbi:phenylacetate--CoA ligase family protein [Pseudoalteromonas sp. Scap03]|uniref:phenylacetate--CoA ligase family protein n=1 Tax=unclassified Pseudoalteromonas TaxID=194690 RepID=UPI0015BCE3AC|nr:MULTISPECIES: phenylacetate--CoA ligase family protein [unclassified Pseudoalteromonas]NWL16061.1 phenylacetate--CoA ligase family protein [Pseudoalteromonas sp. Scap03]QLE81194.1 phenylacetate--CoA ligase family protein [Pseudoalteromonas sp. Scap25]QLE89137.1 phenylacetate--CoA ligase family protein [Pseudoalteromonas sp. Scap06]